MCMICGYFFFFKQKTAYEMRISDWSSDVCSSDLVRAKLDFLLSEARAKPEPPPFPEAGTEVEKTTWYFQHRRTKEFEELLERRDWDGLPARGEFAPAEFLSGHWHGCGEVFSENGSRLKRVEARRVGEGLVWRGRSRV